MFELLTIKSFTTAARVKQETEKESGWDRMWTTTPQHENTTDSNSVLEQTSLPPVCRSLTLRRQNVHQLKDKRQKTGQKSKEEWGSETWMETQRQKERNGETLMKQKEKK